MKNKLAFLNIAVALISLIVLLINKVSQAFSYVIVFSFFVGWLIPYLSLFISALFIIHELKPRLTILHNLLNIILSLFLIIILVKLSPKKLLVPLIEYILIIITCCLNIIYNIVYLRKHLDPDIVLIKKTKEQNNGIIK